MDPRLQSYTGVLPGFHDQLTLTDDDSTAWLDWLREHGFQGDEIKGSLTPPLSRLLHRHSPQSHTSPHYTTSTRCARCSVHRESASRCRQHIVFSHKSLDNLVSRPLFSALHLTRDSSFTRDYHFNSHSPYVTVLSVFRRTTFSPLI